MAVLHYLGLDYLRKPIVVSVCTIKMRYNLNFDLTHTFSGFAWKNGAITSLWKSDVTHNSVTYYLSFATLSFQQSKIYEVQNNLPPVTTIVIKFPNFHVENYDIFSLCGGLETILNIIIHLFYTYYGIRNLFIGIKEEWSTPDLPKSKLNACLLIDFSAHLFVLLHSIFIFDAFTF